MDRTIQDPTPIQHRGEYEFEIVEGGANEMFIFVELEDVMTTLVPIENDDDLQ
ncbi:hypothetical protein [Halocatena salina]|uniref:Uncharacterized protein n=1 Tax=Halocatena salina TaxID=2934340 RepID=A0A8U0A0M3_9EURY|nr:hypothetical protein [Halocatena salina]UPM42622.1 hypothetical protein MW046_11740 [Halocatena salina]